MRRTTRLRARTAKATTQGREALPREQWNLLRAALFQRAGGVCEVCRIRESGLEAHHVIKRSQGGADALDNLVALCRHCHAATDLPYAQGRLVFTVEKGRFEWRVETRADKRGPLLKPSLPCGAIAFRWATEP